MKTGKSLTELASENNWYLSLGGAKAIGPFPSSHAAVDFADNHHIAYHAIRDGEYIAYKDWKIVVPELYS